MSSTAAAPPAVTNRWAMLALATLGFGINFWAWNLLSPLANHFVEAGLTDDTALLVAVPVLVGSVGRIPIGALTDRFGGRILFPLTSVASVIPVLFLGFFGLNSYPMLLLGGFFLGVAGTSFAIGVPYVNSWFPPTQRGLALGIYGMGMGGTALSAFTTVPLTEGLSGQAPFLIVSAVLVVYAIVSYLLMREAPQWTPSTRNIVASTSATMKLGLTWSSSYLYALSFGGYVAFTVYLPVFLQNAYGLEAADASARMGGFVIVAVLMRPLGGALADRFGPVKILVAADALVTLMALILAGQPTLEGLGTVAFLLMALGLGLGTGAVFAVVGLAAKPDQIGSITGFVGAAGGLGGFVPPLILGFLWTQTGSYRIGLLMLAVASAIAIVVAIQVGRSGRNSNQDTDRDAQDGPATENQTQDTEEA